MTDKRVLKMVALVFACLCLSGCVSYEEEAAVEQRPLVTADEQIEYGERIEEMFNSFYWHYDEESVEYYEAKVPERGSDFGEMALSASEDAGFKLSRHSGKTMTCALVNLLFYNGNNAGNAYVYFNGGDIVGVYYVSAADSTKAYSLNDRNVFSANAGFTAFETDTPMVEFNQREINVLKNGFSSEGDNGYEFMTSVIDDGRARIYTLSTSRELGYDENVEVIDCAVSSKEDSYNYIAVILGRKAASGDEAENHQIITDKIELLDKNGSLVAEIVAEDKGYSFVGFDGEYILAGGNGFIDFYRGTTLERSIYAGIDITDMKKCDFDGDGRDEYAVTDGLDLYVCRMENATFSVLWRTNISTKFFESNIYTGDLNGDGISEIYLADINGCGIKYTLSEKGFKYDVAGESGQLWFVGDFNLDGKSDYIESYNEESLPAKLFTAK